MTLPLLLTGGAFAIRRHRSLVIRLQILGFALCSYLIATALVWAGVRVVGMLL